MKQEIITETDEQLMRRMILEPGEAMFWHTDTCRSFTVVVRGSKIAIEYADAEEHLLVDVHPGLAGWDEPEPRVHRAVNVGSDVYEEVVTFHKAAADIAPQPMVEVLALTER